LKSALTRRGHRALFYFQKESFIMSTTAQINANRANSQFSSGPKSDAGKAASSHNAVKSALTGQTILLPTDDVAAYQKLSQVMIDLHLPVGCIEEMLVQSVIDAAWRLLRIPGLESAMYAVGKMELTDQFPAEQVELQIFLKYERQLKNLSLQETRLRRMREKDLAELKKMQAERKEKEEEQKKTTSQPKPEQTVPAPAGASFNEAKQAAPANPSIDISAIGFEFSNPAVA
jgi:hypothetical protein